MQRRLIGLLLRDLVRPVLGQPLLRLGLGQAVWRRRRLFSTSAIGSFCRSSSTTIFDPALDPEALGRRATLPATRKSGDAVFSGSIVRRGEIDALVYATGGKTYFGKTAERWRRRSPSAISRRPY